MADDDAGIVEQARKRFARCVEAEAEQRKLRLDDRRFFAGDSDNGWQWPDEWTRKRAEERRPCLTINKLPQHIKQVSNDFRQNRPQIKIRGVDDRSDPKTAEVLGGVIRHIESASNADYAYDTALECAAVDGLGYWRVVTEYEDEEGFDQKICIKRIRNSFSVYLDPAHEEPDGSDAQYAFVTVMLPKEEVGDAQDWESDRAMAPHWYTETHVRAAEYFRVSRRPKELVTGERRRTAQVPTVQWYKIVGNKVIEQGEIPCRWIPIVKVLGEEIDIDGEIVIKGMIRNGKDAQRQYNVSRSAVVERNGLATKAPWVGPAEAFEGHEQEWIDANNARAYLSYNHVDSAGLVVPAPTRVAPPDVPAGFVQDAMIASDDLKSTMGQYDASLGAKSNESSGKAILARQREGDIATFNYIDNLSRGIRQTGRILVDMIPRVYDTARVLRILGEDDSDDMIRIDPQQSQSRVDVRDAAGAVQSIYNLGVGRFDVAVTVGPSFNTRRQEATEAMVTLTQASPQLMGVIGDLFVKAQDWPGADEMAKRLRATLVPEVRAVADEQASASDMPAEARMMLDRLTQQMQVMGQQMQQLQSAAAEEVAKRDQQIEKLQLEVVRKELEREQADLVAKQAQVDNHITKATQAAQQQIEAQQRQAAEQAMVVRDDALGAKMSAEIAALARMIVAQADRDERQSEMLAAILAAVTAERNVVVQRDASGRIVGAQSTLLQ